MYYYRVYVKAKDSPMTFNFKKFDGEAFLSISYSSRNYCPSYKNYD